MTGAIAIFVKTPGLSPVKTRLADSISKDRAEQFFLMCVKVVEEIAFEAHKLSQGSLKPYWAVAEEEGVTASYWHKFDILWTGEGDLGQRLSHVYSTLLEQHDYVLLIGADSPLLTPQLLLHASQQARKSDHCIIGPTFDGGFYLFGCRLPIPEDLWTNIPYSVTNTSKILKEKLADIGEVEFLPPLLDIDTNDELQQLIPLLKDSSLASQQQLYQWLLDIFPQGAGETTSRLPQ